MGHIAGRVEPVSVDSLHAHPVVDVEPRTRLDAEAIEPDVGSARLATGRAQQLLRVQDRTAAERHVDGAVGTARNRTNRLLGQDPHAGGAQPAEHRITGEGLHLRERSLLLQDHGDVGAQRLPRGRELATDRTTAEYHQALGHRVRRRALPIGPRFRGAQPRDVGDERRAPGADRDRAPGLQGAGLRITRRPVARRYRHLPHTGQPGPAPHQLDVVRGQPRQLTSVVPMRRELVAPGEHRVGGEVSVDRLAGTGDRARLGERVHGAQQCLARDARVVRALAPDELGLDHRDAQPVARGAPGEYFAGRTGPDHDDIEGVHARILAFVMWAR